MEWLRGGVTVGAWVALAWLVRQGPGAAAQTALMLAWRWLLFVSLVLGLMTTSDLVAHLWPDRTADYGWCLASILLVCPPMAVLGARRPGVQYWTPFILVPLIVVLGWPIWTLVFQGGELRGLELETPTVIGFCLMLAMGMGNYLGTRFAPSALIFGASVMTLFFTCTGGNLIAESAKPQWRACAVAGLEVALLVARIPQRRRPWLHPVNRLWDDFRQLYGIVWGLRMVERINSFAAQQQWKIRLTWNGFPESDDGTLTANESEIVEACRWLFRRFVDDEWVAARLRLLSGELQGSKNLHQSD